MLGLEERGWPFSTSASRPTASAGTWSAPPTARHGEYQSWEVVEKEKRHHHPDGMAEQPGGSAGTDHARPRTFIVAAQQSMHRQIAARHSAVALKAPSEYTEQLGWRQDAPSQGDSIGR